MDRDRAAGRRQCGDAVTHRHRTACAALALLVLSGCSPRWVRVEDPATLRPNARTRVQVFSGRTSHDLHGVVFGPDSLAGVPFFKPLTCSDCSVRVARRDVDSLRLISPKDDTPLYVGLGIVVALYVMFSLCQPGGCVPGR